MHDQNLEIPPAPVPWLTYAVQRMIRWRDGDVVVSVPPKSGTNWTMNIVHQLRSSGDAGFTDIYQEVPWLELVPGPGFSEQELAARIDSMPAQPRRVFKTHSGPPLLPYFEEGVADQADVKYVVVLRNPEEVVVSLKPFYEKHRPEWFALWGMPALEPWPNVETFYNQVCAPMGIMESCFGFVAGWWPHRHRDNVLMLHFTDMKADLEGTVRKVARFLGYDPAPDRWSQIVEHCSFAWMKANQDKFEAREIAAIPLLASGAMIRSGRAGAASEEGMTEAIAEDLRRRGLPILTDEVAFNWLYKGGPLP